MRLDRQYVGGRLPSSSPRGLPSCSWFRMCSLSSFHLRCRFFSRFRLSVFLSASAADLKMKFLLLVTLFGRFVAGARNLERGDEGGGKTTSAQWYTPTLPAWTPSSTLPYSKSETCPAQTTLTVTKTVYTGSTKTTTTTVGTPICGGGTTCGNFTTS